VWVRGIWLALTLTRAPKQLLQSKLDGLEREFFGVFDCDPPSNVLVDSVNYVFAGLVVVVGGAILVGLGLLSTQLI
jgi:hypothetical protein